MDLLIFWRHSHCLCSDLLSWREQHNIWCYIGSEQRNILDFGTRLKCGQTGSSACEHIQNIWCFWFYDSYHLFFFHYCFMSKWLLLKNEVISFQGKTPKVNNHSLIYLLPLFSGAKLTCGSFVTTSTHHFLMRVSQVNKLKRDLACMKQELQYKEQGFETLKE